MGRIAVTQPTGDDVEKALPALGPIVANIGRAIAGSRIGQMGAKIGRGAKTAVKENPLTTAGFVQGNISQHQANAEAKKQASQQQTMEAAQHGKEISTGTAKSDDQYYYGDWVLDGPMHNAWAILKAVMAGPAGFPEDDPTCEMCGGLKWVADPAGGFHQCRQCFPSEFEQKWTSEPMEVANRLLKNRMEVGPHDEQQDELFEHLKNLNPQHTIHTNEDDNSFILDNIHDQDEDIARRLIESYDRSFAETDPVVPQPESDYF